ncbi:hypothetical protein B5G50_22055 [Brevibacillus brevis]|uniref:hypothetical protein n=1 Tax=Brevibacillus brevis TaxID=1393 RepID=UPI000B37FC38|nr:hypothetical protein [Brevibacillus brevis]OUQ86265.1 hypothetical protein B5G50_22055 [Brevibacillus brevis]
MSDDYTRYLCELYFNEFPNHNDIKKVVIDVLGDSMPMYNEIDIMELSGEKIGFKLYIRLPQTSSTLLREKLNSINVIFDDIFHRDLRHYHLEIDHNGTEHVGIAIELEDDSWDLYYEEGSLEEKLRQSDEYPVVEGYGFLLGKMEASEIKQAPEIFKKIVVSISG